VLGESPVFWLQMLERELLLFALFWFIIGMVDELAMDAAYAWLRLRGRIHTAKLPPMTSEKPLSGQMAVFVPAWSEAEVIGTTITHMLQVWLQKNYRIYVGCYRNDAPTVLAAMAGAGLDSRLRLVIHDCRGPTTKADCLNRLYQALIVDERRSGQRFRAIMLHDAEDMVHPLGLAVIDSALDSADFVQLPVRPEPAKASRWIAGHYGDEFTEAHAKALVVRDALGAALPAAGVGCGIGRDMLDKLEKIRRNEGGSGPFAAECLTEDYELGLLVARSGGQGRFLRLRDAQGALIATRSLFPTTLPEAVRQKTRWIHGIALQGWDRMGWSSRPLELWMVLRDRRGPLTALVLAVAYLLLLVETILAWLTSQGHAAMLQTLPERMAHQSPFLHGMMVISTIGLVWRAVMRFTFTLREYGFAEALRSVLRIPLANIIAIMAGRRAFAAYLRTLAGGDVIWEKTQHRFHPAHPELARIPATVAAGDGR
jgi:bacteriophage N4 adsorption protein B